MKSLQNFGMGTPGANVRTTPFSAFSYKTYGGAGYHSFFSGGISSTQNMSFPNSSDQIIEINSLALQSSINLAAYNSSDHLLITKNDKVLLKIPLWEICPKSLSYSAASGSFKSYVLDFKRFINPIIVNGADNFKIQLYFSTAGTYIIHLRGKKYSKLSAFEYNEKGKAANVLEKNDFTLYHQKTIATGSNSILNSESNENLYSKLLPLSNRESFVLNAIEIACSSAALTAAEIATAEGEILSYSNELKILVNNVEVLKTSDINLYSYVFYEVPSNYTTSFKHSKYILDQQIIFPSNANVQIYFNAGARTKAPTANIFMFKGELIREVM